MSGFAPFTTTPPVLSNFQWSLGGQVVGQAQGVSGYTVQTVDGLDMPAVRTGDQARPFDMGEFTGDDFVGGRDITLQLLRYGGTSYQRGAAANTLITALMNLLPTAPGNPYAGETETPIWFARPGFGQLCSSVRWRKYGERGDVNLAYFKRSDPLILLHATDPRIYGPTTRTQLVLQPLGSGFKFNFSFPFSFGGGSFIAEATVNNGGQIEMRPLITIVGPCQTPSIANYSLSGNPTVSYGLSLASNQNLVIDMDTETAYYYTVGTTAQIPADSLLLPGSNFWNLPPGNSLVAFSSGGTTLGTCYIDSAPAYIAVV
jgi:hypothetical protein